MDHSLLLLNFWLWQCCSKVSKPEARGVQLLGAVCVLGRAGVANVVSQCSVVIDASWFRGSPSRSCKLRPK